MADDDSQNLSAVLEQDKEADGGAGAGQKGRDAKLGNRAALRPIILNKTRGGVTVFDMYSDGHEGKPGLGKRDVGPKSKVTIIGKGLEKFDRPQSAVMLRIGAIRFKVVNVSVGSASITFYIPKLDKILGGKPQELFVELYSQSEPGVSGVLNKKNGSAYLLFSSAESRDDEEKKKSGGKGTGAETGETGAGGAGAAGPAASAVAAAGEVLAGIAGSLRSPKALNRDKLTEALEKGDKKAIKEAIARAKKLGDSDGLKQALKVAKGKNDKESVKALNEAIDWTDDSKFEPEEAVQKQFEQPTPETFDDEGDVEPAEGPTAEEEETAEITPEIGQYANELVLAHIRSNPDWEQDSPVIKSVTQALTTGEFSNLSAEAQVFLQDAITGHLSSSASTTSATQLQTAMAIVSGQIGVSGGSIFSASGSGGSSFSGRAEATVQTQTEAGATVARGAAVEVKGSATVSGSGDVSAETLASTEPKPAGGGAPGLKAEVGISGTGAASQAAQAAQTTAGSGPQAETPAGTASTLGQPAPDVSQSMRQLGQGLAGTGAIADTRGGEREAVLRALASGNPDNIKNLSPEARTTLTSALKAISAGSDGPLALAARQLLIELDKQPQDDLQTGLTQPVAGGEQAVEPKQIPKDGQAPEKIKGPADQKLPPALDSVQKPSGLSDLEKNRSEMARRLNVPGARRAAKRIAPSGGGLPTTPQKQGAAQGSDVIQEPAGQFLGGPNQPGAGGAIMPAEAAQDLAGQGAAQADAGTDARAAGQGNSGPQPSSQPGGPLQNPASQGRPTEPDAGQNGVGPPPAAAADAAAIAHRDSDKEKLIKEAAKHATKAMNKYLVSWALWLWSLAIPTFGVSVLFGAIGGDFISFFKKSLIKRSMGTVAVGSLALGIKFSQLKTEEIAKKVKFSSQVKFHIFGMNAAVAMFIGTIMMVIVIILKVICGNFFAEFAANFVGLGPICDVINGKGGQQANNINQPATTGAVAGALLSTAQWDPKISSLSAQYSIDACILKVIVQKESAGNSQIIGCDCAKNGHPDYCKEPDPSNYHSGFNFNWDQCSYGIGIAQWTIFPKGGTGFKAWQDPNTPSLKTNYSFAAHPSTWYTVSDLLDPNISLELAAKRFSTDMHSFDKNGPPYTRDDVQAGFNAYVGQSSQQASIVASRMALYDTCKQFSPQLAAGP